MLTNIEVFEKFDKRLKEEIRKGYDSSGVKASGRAGRELNEDIGDKKYTLSGVGYWGAVDKGRSPNRANSGGLRQSIYDWLQYKKYGFNWRTEQERKSLSFAIAKSIAKKGSFKFRNPDKRTTIILDAIKNSLPILSKLLIEKETVTFTVETENIYKNVAKSN
jgi:hypothetical protein